MNQFASVSPSAQAPEGLTRSLHMIYGLHALGLGLGAFGAATVLGSFLFGWPSVIALESHFAWTIRTFWMALAWAAVVALLSLPLTLVLIGFATWGLGLFLLGVWAIYRIARGWLNLKDGRPMPLQ